MSDQTTTQDETTFTTKPSAEDGPSSGSTLGGISIRAWIALILTFTVCYMSGLDKAVKEPLYSAFLLTLGFYFGTKTQPQQAKT